LPILLRLKTAENLPVMGMHCDKYGEHELKKEWRIGFSLDVGMPPG
jgi:hypothetical protein